MLEYLSKLTGIENDKINFVVSLYICYPFAYILKQIISDDLISVSKRNFFNAIVGMGILLFNFKWASLHPLLLTLISYFLVRYKSSTNIGVIVTSISMLHLSFCHIHRLFYDSYGHYLDITAPMMVIIQRISLFAFHVQDEFNNKTNEKIPSSIDFMGYCFFFPSVLAGPSMDYNQYSNFISGKIVKEYRKVHGKDAPSLIKPTLYPLLLNFITFGLYVYLTSKFPSSFLFDSKNIKQSGFFVYLFYLFIVTFSFRCRYYGTWSLSESCCNLCYAGFDGLDKNNQEDWTVCKNVNILGVEFASSQKLMLDNWNICTSKWLRSVVYLRTPSNINMFLTFFASSVWHGFFIGYYYVFFLGFASAHMARMARRKFRPFFCRSKFLKIFYDILTTILTYLNLNYHIISFIFMSIADTNVIWKKLKYFGHMMNLVCVIIILFPLKRNKKEQ